MAESNTGKVSDEVLDQMYVDFMTKAQFVLREMITEFITDKSIAMGITLNATAYSVGSSLASTLYELVRKDDQLHTLLPSQDRWLRIWLDDFVVGYTAKVQLINNPEEMTKIAKPIPGNGSKH